jgi:hypothetical protein
VQCKCNGSLFSLWGEQSAQAQKETKNPRASIELKAKTGGSNLYESSPYSRMSSENKVELSVVDGLKAEGNLHFQKVKVSHDKTHEYSFLYKH